MTTVPLGQAMDLVREVAALRRENARLTLLLNERADAMVAADFATLTDLLMDRERATWAAVLALDFSLAQGCGEHVRCKTSCVLCQQSKTVIGIVKQHLCNRARAAAQGGTP